MAKKSFVIHKGTPDFSLEYSNISLSRSGDNLIAKITDAQLHLDSGYYWFYYRVAIKLTLYSDAAKTKKITSKEKTFITKPKPIDFYKDPNGFAVSGSNEKCWFDAKGSYAKNGYFPKDSVTDEVSIDVSTYTGTIYADVLVYGESDSGDTTDMNGDGVADQDCPCSTHGEALKNGTFTLWTDVNAGSIDIVDNGDNTFTIDATSGSAGIGNDVHLNRIFYKIVPSGTDADDIAYTYNDDYNFESGNKSMSNISITEDCTVYAFVRTYGTMYGTPANPGGDTRNRADSTTDSQVVKLYVAPNPPTSIWYVSNGKSSASDGTFEPRLKKELSWRWTGASPGNSNSSITGYFIFIYKNEVVAGASGTAFYLTSPSSDADSSITNEPSSNGTPGHKIETTLTSNTNLNFKFIPKDEGFVNNDKCICRVFSATTWGDDSIHYSTTGVKGECILKNGAVVWVNVDTDDDGVPDTWTEGTVYVYDGTTWQEAEGVYVCTEVNEDTGKATWTESN